MMRFVPQHILLHCIYTQLLPDVFGESDLTFAGYRGGLHGLSLKVDDNQGNRIECSGGLIFNMLFLVLKSTIDTDVLLSSFILFARSIIGCNITSSIVNAVVFNMAVEPIKNRRDYFITNVTSHIN